MKRNFLQSLKKLFGKTISRNSKKIISFFLILLLILLSYTAFNINKNLSDINIQSYNGKNSPALNSQNVFLLIEHNKSILKGVSLLINNPSDSNATLLSLPLDVYYEWNGSQVTLPDVFGLKYLIEDEYKSYLKIRDIIESAYQININEYFVLPHNAKESLSNIYQTNKALPLNDWIIEIIKNINFFSSIFNSSRIRESLESNVYSSLNNNALLKVIQQLKDEKVSSKYFKSDLFKKDNESDELKSFNFNLVQNDIAKALTESSVIEEQARIEIYNATPVDNLGSQYANKFKNLGLSITRVNTVPKFSEKTYVYIQNEKPSTLTKVKNILGDTVISHDKSPYLSISDIIIILGNDKVQLK